MHIAASAIVPQQQELDLQDLAGRGPWARCALLTWLFGLLWCRGCRSSLGSCLRICGRCCCRVFWRPRRASRPAAESQGCQNKGGIRLCKFHSVKEERRPVDGSNRLSPPSTSHAVCHLDPPPVVCKASPPAASETLSKKGPLHLESAILSTLLAECVQRVMGQETPAEAIEGVWLEHRNSMPTSEEANAFGVALSRKADAYLREAGTGSSKKVRL